LPTSGLAGQFDIVLAKPWIAPSHPAAVARICSLGGHDLDTFKR
jgi:hypothetical protein